MKDAYEETKEPEYHSYYFMGCHVRLTEEGANNPELLEALKAMVEAAHKNADQIISDQQLKQSEHE